MNHDVRNACLTLVRSGTGAANADRIPRPAALGWKLEGARLATPEVDALLHSVHAALADAAPTWMPSAPLRALLAEYAALRRGARRIPSARLIGVRRLSRPADCA
jgi:hypothetical protein